MGMIYYKNTISSISQFLQMINNAIIYELN